LGATGGTGLELFGRLWKKVISVTDALNLPLEKILSGTSITAADASAIHSKYPQLSARMLAISTL